MIVKYNEDGTPNSDKREEDVIPQRNGGDIGRSPIVWSRLEPGRSLELMGRFAVDGDTGCCLNIVSDPLLRSRGIISDFERVISAATRLPVLVESVLESPPLAIESGPYRPRSRNDGHGAKGVPHTRARIVSGYTAETFERLLAGQE